MSKIRLGTVVRDKVTGFVGVAENRCTFMYGCDRYCVQPRVGEDGKIPDSAMIDEPQLEIVAGEELAMEPVGEPVQIVQMGRLVFDPVRSMEGTITGRAVYLNGCSRVFIEPKQAAKIKLDSWWVDENQIERCTTFTGNPKITKQPNELGVKTGGPARSNSKY
jgi:hypothetical protein